MSATEKKQLAEKSFEKLGIIAGSGVLPKKLAKYCAHNNIQPFIIAFEGQTPEDTVNGYEHMWCNLGAAGKVIKTLKSHDIHDIVMIGGIRRPSFSELKPDFKGAEVLARIGLKAMGDNDLLELLKAEFTREGFCVHGVHIFLKELLAPKGLLGKIKPSAKMEQSIRRGVQTCREIGKLDIGQAVIIQQGIVIGVEGIEGTDELIRRCKGYLKKGDGGILVKTSKPQQDKSLDLPTIGPDTVISAVESGLAGIVVEADSTVFVDSDVMREIADKNRLFIIGVDTKDYL